jgi:hypothetical protein
MAHAPQAKVKPTNPAPRTNGNLIRAPSSDASALASGRPASRGMCGPVPVALAGYVRQQHLIFSYNITGGDLE